MGCHNPDQHFGLLAEPIHHPVGYRVLAHKVGDSLLAHKVGDSFLAHKVHDNWGNYCIYSAGENDQSVVLVIG